MAGGNGETEQYLSGHAIWVAWGCQANLISEAGIIGFLAELRRELGGDPQLPAAVYWDKMTPEAFSGLTGQHLIGPKIRVYTFPEQLSVCGDIYFPDGEIPIDQTKLLVTNAFNAVRVEMSRNSIPNTLLPQGLTERLNHWDYE